MSIDFPDTFTAENSERYVMSIRLCAGGLSFSANIPAEINSFFYSEVFFDDERSYEESLKEFFFDNEFFSWGYKRVYVIAFSNRYAFMPEELFDGKKVDDVMKFLFTKTESKCLESALKGEKGRILFDIEKGVYEFLFRSFVNPIFLHHLVPTLDLWYMQVKDSGLNKMFVSINRKTIDVICFKDGEFRFINSFEYGSVEDIMFLILNVWKQMSFNQVDDELLIGGGSFSMKLLLDNLRIFINNVNMIKLPSEAYLFGNGTSEIAAAPFDIIALAVCE